MKLSKNTVRAVVGLMVAALAGLVYLQFNLLSNTIELKEQTFRRNVFAALNDATDRLEEIEARNRVFLINTNSTNLPQHILPGSKKFSALASSFTKSRSGVSTWMENNRVRYSLERPQHVFIRAFNVLGRLDTTLVNEPKSIGEHDIALPKDKFGSGITFVQIRTDSAMQTLRWEPGTVSLSVTVEEKEESRNKIAQRVFRSFLPPPDSLALHARIAPKVLDSLIAHAMEKNGVSLPFEFMVINSKGGSVEFARPEPVHQEDFEGGFSASLFPHGLVPDPNRLWIRFPTYNRYLMKELLPPLGASLVLVAAIVFCFWFTIRVIIRQKEFAGRLTDFINNMTHEFKTPISTIALASEAIAQQGSARSISKTSKYNSVIADENKRMKHQVDKILQMATLEEGKGEFNRSQLDAHEVIERAVENFALQIAARGGSMTIELNAAQNWMLADPVHFENVIHNVLENAVKYSPSAPIITVRTNNDNGGLCIEVSDRGIGIATEHADKVFDKYYRVSTGNLHDVKGFGLGLSYVKLVVQAHGGNVSLVSTPGQGTTVSMNFPLV